MVLLFLSKLPIPNLVGPFIKLNSINICNYETNHGIVLRIMGKRSKVPFNPL